MPEAATQTIVAAAYDVLNADATLTGRGYLERAHPVQDTDLPRWIVQWESERANAFINGEYDCEADLIFIALAQGDGANARVDGWRYAAQSALAASGHLNNLVRSLRYREASRDLDETGRARTGSIRVRFYVSYETDINGALLAR